MARVPVDPPRQLLLLKLLPNLVSILALCAGLTAIRYAIAGNYSLAVLLIGLVVAAVCYPFARIIARRKRQRGEPTWWSLKLHSGDREAARATLGGVLATICPADKKIIHGMTDAILAPCAA